MGAAGGCSVMNLLMVSQGVSIFGSGFGAGLLVVVIGLLASFLTAALICLLYSILVVTLYANQNVTGLTMTIFGVGTMKFIMAGLSESRYLFALSFFRFPFSLAEPGTWLRSMQLLGVMVWLGILIAIAASFLLKRTRVGLNLRAVGENPATADAVGLNVKLYKYLATVIGSGIAGLGGLFYVMDYSGSPEAYKSIEPFGWLSIALVIFALWRPNISIFGSIVFGALFIAGYFLPSVQGLHLHVSSSILKMLPYVVTLVVLIVTSIRNKRENQPPAGLGVNYYREER
jgi:simple sugar transport system permease protein